MKNYTKPSPRTRSYQNTSLDLSRSLFMDETSADLETYLNSSLPETSSVNNEQDLECSTINALSKNIKGKFQKSYRDSKKNKFFKSKSSEDKMPVDSSEIPVINEAMKKIFKETSYEPNLKPSPKVLKTYSNKHKDKTQIVESFGLPDEPIDSVDPSFMKENNSIDLDIEAEKNLSNSLIFGQWMPSDVHSSDFTINDDFRRKSFSTIDTALFGTGSLETDVKEGFNFEEDNLVQEHASKPSNEENIWKNNKNPVVLMKSLNLNDIRILETNNLSPSKNSREMLLDRWQRFSLKLKNNKSFQKGNVLQRSPKYCSIEMSNTNSRRSTRSDNSTIQFDVCTSKKNTDDVIKHKSENNASVNDLHLQDICSPVMVEKKYKSCEENQKILQNIDLLSPRRITRRSAQQTVDSLPININNELCSLNFMSPDRRNEYIVEGNSTVNKNEKKSKTIKIIGEPENEEEISNTKSVKDKIINIPSENVIDITSPSKSRSIRTSLRSSNSLMKLENEMISSSSGEQKSIQINTSTSKKSRYSLQKELENLLGKARASATLKVDNSSVLGKEVLVKKQNFGDEINVKQQTLNIDNQSSSSPSKGKILSRTKNPDNSQESDTPTRKSNRLKLHSDENSKHLNQSVQENSISKKEHKLNNTFVKDLKSPTSNNNNNKKTHENAKTFTNNEVPNVQGKRSRGRPRKMPSEIQDNLDLSKSLEDEEQTQKSSADKKFTQNQSLICLDSITKSPNVQEKRSSGRSRKMPSEIQDNLDLSKSLEDEERTQKSSADKKLAQNQSLICLDNITKTPNVQELRSSGRSRMMPSVIQDNLDLSKSLEDEANNSKVESSKIINISLHHSDGENIHNKVNVIEEHCNKIQLNRENLDESITGTDSEIILTENNISYLNNPELIKRKRGRPKKKIQLRQDENESKRNTLMNDKTEQLMENHNEILINTQKHDESIPSTDSEVLVEECNISNLDNQESTKRKRGRPKKRVELKQHEFKGKTCLDKNMDQMNGKYNGGDIKNVSVVNNGKPICNNQENTKKNAKEGCVEEEIGTASVIFHDDKIRDNLGEHQFRQCDEMLSTVVIEEKQNCGDCNIKEINGKKRKLHEEFSILDIFQGSKSDERSGQIIEDSHNELPYDEKLGNKLEIDQKTSNITLETKSKFSMLVQDDGNHQVHYLNDQKVDKSILRSDVMTSFSKLPNGRESVTQIKEIDNPNNPIEYSDFGYDIHRRTSFRKILERVMEASRIEMEVAKSENRRDQRCKSVPLEEFRGIKETNDIEKSASADSKFKYLKDGKNSYSNTNKADFWKVKKCLNYISHSKFDDNSFSSRKRTKSFHSRRPDDTFIHQQTGKNSYLEEIKSSKNGIVSTLNVNTNCSDKDPTKVMKSESFVRDTRENLNNGSQKKSVDDDSFYVEPDSRLSASSGKYMTDNEDVEVENILLGKISNAGSYERTRSKSFSEGKSIQKFNYLSKSVQGKKFKKRYRTSGGMTGSTDAVKKVHEFQVGDPVWGKVGKYPYWPGLVMEDPETSDFKKFKLLRTTPYYHIRFFGDNGKRAWTSYCLPYEGAEDLDVLRKQYSTEGYQNDYLVRAAHLEKWKKAVQEAECVKTFSLEEKITFFDKILLSNERIHTPVETEGVPTEKPHREINKSFSFSTSLQKTNKNKSENDTLQKEKAPMKESSLISCIESVVKNFNETPCESDCNVSSPRSPIKVTTFLCNADVTESSKNVKKTSIEIKTNISSQKKKSNDTKDSSVLACIDDVNKFCSPSVNNFDENSTQKKTKESRKTIQDVDSEIDLGLELTEISAAADAIMASQKIDLKSPQQNSFCKSPKQSTSSGTPVSSRKARVNSPTKTRSRSSLKLEKRLLSEEFKQEDEPPVSSKEPVADSVPSCSPRRLKLKRRTIEIGRIETDTESSAYSFLNDITSRLPENKKNLFKGVTKEKVCQICEKSGEVVKCRGPCNGDFHIKCVESSLKETEELTMMEQEELTMREKLDIPNQQLDELMVDNKQVEITTVISRKKFADNVVLSPVNRKIPIMEQFDRKMKELMSQVESRISIDSTDTSSEDIDTLMKVQVDKKSKGKNSKKRKAVFKHVTADDVSVISLSDVETTKQKDSPSENIEQTSNADEGVYKCSYCTSTVIPPCFVCNSIVSKNGNTMRQRCSLQKCGRYYHLECLNIWHQTQWSFILHDKKKTEALDSFVCPRHSCHICASENLGFSMGRCPNDKLVKCLRCPATYHNSYHCVPAGTEILTSTQIICPRHVEGNKKSNTLNTIWCFVCSEGGNLICCETCPTSVHSECLPVNLLDDDTYICEDCESGRFPLYDEVVWVKCGTFRWWPAIILFPAEVPANVDSKPHKKGEFVVKFFGTYNYFWVGRGRAFLYQEGDTGYLNNTKNKIDEAFSRAIKEAADVYNFKKGLRAKKQKEVNNGLKPPPYVRIKVNRPVGNVRVFEGNLSNTTPCDCNPKDKSPCGPNSNCLNRILLTECNPEICPAGERCKNQAFEKREYPQVKPYRTAGRGWGLITLEPIKKGQFVIEYVGEVIDDEEYQRRITRMHQQKDENYYFLTIDKDRMLDAGPKGNAARFMNHSCNPNCETQKWTVNGDTRVGLFAIENILADTELTFNYNLECAGTEKKICRCGAPNCSGFIGVKPEDQRSMKKNSTVKPVERETPTDSIVNDTCFICGQPGDVGKCTHKTCLNSYHLECVQLDSWPKGKWKCPSHTCNVCSKSTSRICVHCNNSYCSNHLEGNIRHDDTVGYLCAQHDQVRKKSTRRRTAVTGTSGSTSSNCQNTSKKKRSSENGTNETLRSERYRKRTSCFESNIPQKKLKLND